MEMDGVEARWGPARRRGPLHGQGADRSGTTCGQGTDQRRRLERSRAGSLIGNEPAPLIGRNFARLRDEHGLPICWTIRAALTTDLAVLVDAQEDSWAADRTEIALPDEFSILDGVLRVLAVRVRSVAHHSSPSSDSPSAASSAGAGSDASGVSVLDSGSAPCLTFTYSGSSAADSDEPYMSARPVV